MGNLYKGPEQPLTEKAFELREVRVVGSYAVQPLWADGHNTGLYSFEYLKDVSAASK